MTCYECGKKGHKRPDCPDLRNNTADASRPRLFAHREEDNEHLTGNDHEQPEDDMAEPPSDVYTSEGDTYDLEGAYYSDDTDE